MASKEEDDYTQEPGVVKDEMYEEWVKHGDDEFKPPPEEAKPNPGHKYELRHAKPKGPYDESMGEPFQGLDNGEFQRPDLLSLSFLPQPLGAFPPALSEARGDDQKDIDRRVASYVARSHDPRTPEDHKKSAGWCRIPMLDSAS